ncbi:MAG: nucleoside deaminase [Candidatus Omnitrophica bacterium]|nr:nucleoside deaminase [Candidatus Omnitrophota bacterium]
MKKALNIKFMKLAIKEARKNIKTMDGGPFGACIVKNGRILAVARNTVLKSDATSHAEINAIRQASRKIKNFDLSGCIIYSTTEPCPMCFSAIHWAKIGMVIYGTTISDAKKIGFNELSISCRDMKKEGSSRVKLSPGVLRKECVRLLRDWGVLENKVLY